MKVLYDDNVFNWQKYGGISRYFAELMVNAGDYFLWELSLLFSDNAYLPSYYQFSAIKPCPLNQFFFEKWNFSGKSLLKKGLNKLFDIGPLNPEIENRNFSMSLLQAGNFDVFHPTYYDEYFLQSLKTKPFVLTVHDMIHERFPQYFDDEKSVSKTKLKLINAAKEIIAISESTKFDIISLTGISAKKITVVPHASSFEVINQNNSGTKDNNEIELNLPKRYILFTGSRSGYKNFGILVSAFAEVLNFDKDLFLVCTGAAFSPEEKRFLVKKGVYKQVQLYSATDKQLIPIYQNALCFVFPSLYEGFGLPILEAFSCGCPAILSNSSSLPEVGGNAALYFEPTDAKKLCDLIRDVLESGALRMDLQSKGYEQLKKYSWALTTELTAEVYKKACK